MLVIVQPCTGPVIVAVGPAFTTAMPQPFLKSRALAKVKIALPEVMLPVVDGSNGTVLELHPPAGLYEVMSRHGPRSALAHRGYRQPPNRERADHRGRAVHRKISC